MGNCEYITTKMPEDPATINKNIFQQLYVIGKGGYGKVRRKIQLFRKVWKVKNKRDNQDYAMKEMSKSVILAKKSVTSINFEKELLSRLNHRFICNICYAFQDDENLYLVIELSNGGDLRYHLFRNIQFNESQTSK